MLNGLGLFAGIGGLELGLERSGVCSPVAFVEKDEYCQKVLVKRFPEVPIWDDVSTFDGRPWKGRIDIISGGFPCQDISGAGKGAGLKEGTRSGLWFEFLRIIGEVRPCFAVIENVPLLTIRGGTRVITDLTSIGYNSEWIIISASSMGAPHLRKRIFIVAYPQGIGYRGGDHKERRIQRRELEPSQSEGDSLRDQTQGCGSESREDVADPQGPRGGSIYPRPGEEGEGTTDSHGCSKNVADPERIAERTRLRQEKPRRIRRGRFGNGDWWTAEPDVGRVAHGIPARVDRLKCLGNAVVPQCAEYIGRLILDALSSESEGR